MTSVSSKPCFALVSRTFWPVNPAIGEALLLTAEQLVEQGGALVIAQASPELPGLLARERRGKGAKFSLMRSMTDSASSMPLRVCELLLFACFVFLSLCHHRPRVVYVATNPPLLVPMVVRWYCWLFRRKYTYHLQDIHPEATTVVTGKTSWGTRLLQRIDCKTIINANLIITLTQQMQKYLTQRVGKNKLPPVVLLDNPSVQGLNTPTERQVGLVYCGNAGRLQRIPLLLKAIDVYSQRGGNLPFFFAGGGVFAADIQKLACKFNQVSYLGVLPAAEAAQLMQSYAYGLMPIDDEVTQYAFPSKSSSYVFSGCQVIAICGAKTAVAQWVHEHNLGYIVEPDLESIVNCFFALERQPVTALRVNDDLLQRLTPQSHANTLVKLLTELEGKK